MLEDIEMAAQVIVVLLIVTANFSSCVIGLCVPHLCMWRSCVLKHLSLADYASIHCKVCKCMYIQSISVEAAYPIRLTVLHVATPV